MELKFDGLKKEAIFDEEKINNGVWVHLESAATDSETGQTSPLYLHDDETKPQRALVRSYRCQALKDLEAKRQKDGFTKIRVAKKKDRDAVIADTALIPDAERFGYFLAAVDNFSGDGGIQQVDPAAGRELYGVIELDNIIQQIKEAAYDDDLYLATAGTPEGNGSASTSTAKTTAKPVAEEAPSLSE